MIGAVLAAATLALHPGGAQSFESLSSIPKDWKLVEFVDGAGTASIQTGDAADGKRFLHLQSSKPNHTRLVIPATVRAHSIYRFSAMVRTSGSQPRPALLALNGDDGDTTGNTAADGQWHERDLYIETGTATSISVVLSLGWFADTVAGSADFDLVRLHRVSAVPTGGIIAHLGPVAPQAAASAAATSPAATSPGTAAATSPAAAATSPVETPVPTSQAAAEKQAAAIVAAAPGPSKILIPLGALLVLLIGGCGAVLLRGRRAD